MEESLARGEMERSTKDNHIRQEHHSWPSEANKSLFNGTVSRDCQPLFLWSTGLHDFSGLLDYTIRYLNAKFEICVDGFLF